jgi:hypothetical protein
MAKKSGKMRYYAIHLPIEHRGVYYNYWANVRDMAQKSGAKHRAFDDQKKAEYFVLHGHEEGRVTLNCATCVQEKKNPGAQEQSMLQRHQQAPLNEFSKSIKEEDNMGTRLQDLHVKQNFGCCYAVVRGIRPGVYDDWDEAKKQLQGFSGNDYVECPDQASAVRYLRARGIPIRLFHKTFKLQPNFMPNPTASFKQEFQRFASSQQMTDDVRRKARVDAIRDEIIQYFLPEGVRISDEQDDDEGYVHLDDDQTLEVFQAMCRKAGKSVHSSIDESLLELKRCPFVNILDFVDTFRTGTDIRTFRNWKKFVIYTRAGRTMDMQVAKENEFLAPLLQDLCKGPGAVDPRKVRQRLVAARETLRMKRTLKQEKIPLNLFSPDHHRSLSPSNFDRDMSFTRSPTPAMVLPPPEIALGHDEDDHVKLEHLPAAPCDSPLIYEYPSAQPMFSYSKQQEPNIKLEASQAAPFTPVIDLTQEAETDHLIKFEREDSISASSSSSFAQAVCPIIPTDISGYVKQEFKWEALETVPHIVQSSEAALMIDLTQDEDTEQIMSAPLTTTTSLRKRPRLSSPRVLLQAKKSRTGVADGCTLYRDLPLTQEDIR